MPPGQNAPGEARARVDGKKVTAFPFGIQVWTQPWGRDGWPIHSFGLRFGVKGAQKTPKSRSAVDGRRLTL